MLQRIVNTAMIDYTLEWLIINGIEIVYITCCAFADQIRRHLGDAGYLSKKNVHIELVVSTDCQSVGDAMRLLDHKDMLKSDFVLVSGDVITNMDLRGAVLEHRHRRAKDKSAIMTMVLKGGMGGGRGLRLGDLGAVTVMDGGDGRLLRFEERRDADGSLEESSTLALDSGFFDGRSAVTVRTDLIDTGIYICSHEVLMLFSDNFDYQNIRKDFVAGVLSEEELGNKLYVHEVKDRYATRVRNVRCFAAVTRDILGRWTFPFVPDSNLFSACVGGARGEIGGEGGGGQNLSSVSLQSLSLQNLSTGGLSLSSTTSTQYMFSKGKVYMDTGVSVARTAKIQHSVCVGRGSVIGPGVVVRNSVIGKNCRIGEGAEIVGCVLGDEVTVHRRSSVRDSLLCDGVVVNEQSRVLPDCILSYNVVIDAGVTVPADSRISLAKPPTDSCQFDVGSDDEFDDMDEVLGSSAGRYGSFGASSSGGHFEDVAASGGKAVTPAARAAAAALANGGVPETDMDFDSDVVGKMGAGYLWRMKHAHSNLPIVALRRSMAADRSLAAVLRAETLRAKRLIAAEETFLDENGLTGKGDDRDSGFDSDDADDKEMEMMQDHHFKEEVAETFLRCIKEHISQENVVIELNGLKIAEDKTFADCARFILTTCLGLCLPAHKGVIAEYRGLYPADRPAGLRDLLKRAHNQLTDWASLLQKFLKNEDDQVEVLLTLEEFCGGEGDFEETGEFGAEFVGIFPQVLQVMYDLDILTEDAALAWAEEKEHASETEKRFLKLAGPFLTWLQEAESEESEDSEESSSDEE